MVIISDFLDLEDELIEAIRILRFHKHELVVFHVLSPEELKFPFEDFSTFVDLETGSTLSLEARTIKNNYEKKFRSLFERDSIWLCINIL